VLASAGLDAFVVCILFQCAYLDYADNRSKFLAFFKMAIKHLAITLLFAVVIIKPVHDHFPENDGSKPNATNPDAQFLSQQFSNGPTNIDLKKPSKPPSSYKADYLWMYLVFAYFFTFLAFWLITTESKRIIEIRQQYLGSQSTITDRTIRLSGIPPELRSEEKIKEFVEELEIGKVESVLLCRNWKELDDLMVKRMTILRRLEEAWTVYLGNRRIERSRETLPITQPVPPGPEVGDEEQENSSLLRNEQNGNSHPVPYSRTRPQTFMWYGRFRLRYKTVDAIDYYEEQLRRLDDKIRDLRKKEFEACPIAFVTMDSVASCVSDISAAFEDQVLISHSKWQFKLYWTRNLSSYWLNQAQRPPTSSGQIRIYHEIGVFSVLGL